MPVKPSETQRKALQRMIAGDGTIWRERGGFWVSEKPEGLDHNGVPYFSDEKKTPADWTTTGFYIERSGIGYRDRWCDVRTVRAMEKNGWVERTNTFPEEWRDTRRITDQGRAA